MLYYVYIISYTFFFTHVPGRLAFPLLYPVKIVFWRYLPSFFSMCTCTCASIFFLFFF